MSNMNESQEMVKLTINNIPIEVPKGTKIMQAAKVLGKKRLLAACSTEVWEGMDVHTDTQIVRDTQVSILQLMLANHHKDCLSCPRNQNCDLQRLCSRFNIMESPLPSVASIACAGVMEQLKIEMLPSTSLAQTSLNQGDFQIVHSTLFVTDVSVRHFTWRSSSIERRSSIAVLMRLLPSHPCA